MITIQSKAGVLKDMIYVKWLLVVVALVAFTVTMMVSGAFYPLSAASAARSDEGDEAGGEQ
ncbi:hypothetical protein ACFTAO_09325 [Paenibacillus rhizoplanae]